MKKNRWKLMIGSGVFCILFLLCSVWYAVTCNDSRLVVPMDFDSYVFQVQDLPMIISVLFVWVYVFALVVFMYLHLKKKRQLEQAKNITRKLSPKLGFLGLFGFLGFAGIWTFQTDGSVFPFLFFVFFGFFGFFFESKMSGTFMDERFRENADRAQLIALRTTVTIIFIALILLGQDRLFGKLEYTLIALSITLSLALALGVFLSEYLLYRLDYDEEMEDGE